MDGFNDFVERMKVEKDGFAELWESRRIIRELETVMISKEINQATISERTGLKQSAISRFFSCKNSPNIDTVIKIATALGCKLELMVKEVK